MPEQNIAERLKPPWTWLLLLVTVLTNTVHANATPLTGFLDPYANIHPHSLTLSSQFDYPIIYVDQDSMGDTKKATALLNQIQLPDTDAARVWQENAFLALSGHFDKGFSVNTDQLPCLVMSEGSYSNHVMGENFLDILVDYAYNPYANNPEQFEQMVLFHELGHCFESYDAIKAEHFADVFAALFLLKQQQDWSVLYEELIPSRTLNLVNGDYEHYSAAALRSIRNWIDQPSDLEGFDTHELIQLAHIIINDEGAVPDKEEIQRLQTQLQFMVLEIAIDIDRQDIDFFADDPSDRAEEIRDYLVQRQARNRQQLHGLLDDIEPGDTHLIRELLEDIAINMYKVRKSRTDMYNDLQKSGYVSDVENLFRAAGFPVTQQVSDLMTGAYY